MALKFFPKLLEETKTIYYKLGIYLLGQVLLDLTWDLCPQRDQVPAGGMQTGRNIVSNWVINTRSVLLNKQ